MADIDYIQDLTVEQYPKGCSDNHLFFKENSLRIPLQDLLWLYISLFDKAALGSHNTLCVPIEELSCQLGISTDLIKEGLDYLKSQGYLETVKYYLTRAHVKKHQLIFNFVSKTFGV